MADPSISMACFQKALSVDAVSLRPGDLDNKIFLHKDTLPTGSERITYVRLEKRIVTAYVALTRDKPIDGVPCFQIGYAVPVIFRNRGRAKDAVRAATAELWSELSRTGPSSLCIAAAIDRGNRAANRVAAATLSDAPEEITDPVSGLPVLRYLKRLGISPVS